MYSVEVIGIHPVNNIHSIADHLLMYINTQVDHVYLTKVDDGCEHFRYPN